MASPIIETSLEKVLDQISQNLKQTNQKLDALQKDVTDIKVGQARLEERLTTVEKDIIELKGTTKNQLWSLIVLLGGTLLTIGAKVFIFPGKT